MKLIGIFFALGAGLFFGILAPTTKISYNLGAGIGLAIILRYFVASLLIVPLIPSQKNLINIYKNNLSDFITITFGSIFLTSGLLISVKYIEVSLAILIFCTYPILVLCYAIFFDKEKITNGIKSLFLLTFIGLFFVLGPSFINLNIINFPVFNIADISINIGFIILLYNIFKNNR